MAFQDVMHTSNPIFEYAFSWKIDNFSETSLEVQGPTFQPIPGHPGKFRFEVAVRKVTEKVCHPDFPSFCDECSTDTCDCTILVRVLDLKLICLDDNDLPLSVLVDITLGDEDNTLYENTTDVTKVEQTTTLGCLNPFELSVHYCQLTMRGTLQFSGFRVTSNVYPSSVQQPLKNFRELSKNLKTMYENGLGSDVTFSVGEEKLHAHKAILSCRSPVFAKMFEHDMLENNTNNVIIEDTDSRIFDCFLMFLYSGSVVLDEYKTVMSLYSVAHKYQVKSLLKTCTLWLTNQLTVESVWKVVALADLYGNEELKNVVKTFIRENFFDILKTVKWQELVTTNPKLAIDVMSYVKSVDNGNEIYNS